MLWINLWIFVLYHYLGLFCDINELFFFIFTWKIYRKVFSYILLLWIFQHTLIHNALLIKIDGVTIIFATICFFFKFSLLLLQFLWHKFGLNNDISVLIPSNFAIKPIFFMKIGVEFINGWEIGDDFIGYRIRLSDHNGFLWLIDSIIDR